MVYDIHLYNLSFIVVLSLMHHFLSESLLTLLYNIILSSLTFSVGISIENLNDTQKFGLHEVRDQLNCNRILFKFSLEI